MVINKAIVGASYDDSGGISEVIKKIESQAIKEKQKSGRSQHNLYRSIDDVNSSKEKRQCCAGQDILDAKRVSQKLNINHKILYYHLIQGHQGKKKNLQY